MEVDISKLPQYKANRNYIFVHFVIGIDSIFAKSCKYEVTPFHLSTKSDKINAFSLAKASITIQTVYFQAAET